MRDFTTTRRRPRRHGCAASPGACRSRRPGWGPAARVRPRWPRTGADGADAGRRPNVRAAVLRLLAERPMHGYEMITELETRTSGVWRPSPGSVYPTLQLLEDEGLSSARRSGRSEAVQLTDAGRAEAERGRARPRRGHEFGDESVEDWHDLKDAAFGAMNALRQVMMTGTDEQRQRAVEVIAEARRKLYAILADLTSRSAADQDARSAGHGQSGDRTAPVGEERAWCSSILARLGVLRECHRRSCR